ncbi:hypothetical protein [Afipia sp. GAS231]|uniref:hypothetical protein n=1 Tax=Afipia sp. GAS231 TaxID=1882747 RepID=UPI000879A42F|nr:hypothetical protein [Afipia sp. GAS231]SDO94947.1 hypothetical protein SAMN05444050_5422 [Afipia sp. GAS231]
MAFLKVLAAILILCVAGAIGLYAAYPWFYPTFLCRYRLTANVAIGERQYSGSSVIEVKVETQPRLLDSPRWNFGINGDATFVDLGGGRNLVALLNPGPSKGTDVVTLLFRAFNVPFSADNAAEVAKLSGERRLDPANWPAFVIFQDVNEARSIKAIDPPLLPDIYGSGARIESVTVSITSDPISRGLEEKLPWLASAFSIQEMVQLAKIHIARSQFIGSNR